MKKLSKVLFFAVIALSLVFAGCSSGNNKIVGEWKFEKDDYSMSLIFGKDKSFAMIENGRVLGRGEEDYGHKTTITYEVDDTKEPKQLDLLYFWNDEKVERSRIRCIYRFITDDKIQVKMSFGDAPRAASFTDEDQGHIFDRVTK